MAVILPDQPKPGDPGHVTDTAMILAAIQDLDERKIEALKIGTVSTGEAGTEVYASITGGDTLHLQIPRGNLGPAGPGFIIVDYGQDPPAGTPNGTVVLMRGA